MSEQMDEGYRGPAVLVCDGHETPVEVMLAGHFDPISGRYNWYGRVVASAAVTELITSGAREVGLRTPHGEVRTALSDVDPWGRPRVEGFGGAPFEILDHVDE